MHYRTFSCIPALYPLNACRPILVVRTCSPHSSCVRFLYRPITNYHKPNSLRHLEIIALCNNLPQTQWLNTTNVRRLAGSVIRTLDSWSCSGEFEAHVGCGSYLKNKILFWIKKIKNRIVFSPSSGGQKSKISITEVKSRCQQGGTPSGCCREKSVPFPSQPLVADSISWPVTHHPSLASVVTWLFLPGVKSPSTPSHKNICDYI